MTILSCEHCQIVEDNEIIWGCGFPICLCELQIEFRLVRCPNCDAVLNEYDSVLVNLTWVPQFLVSKVNTGGF